MTRLRPYKDSRDAKIMARLALRDLRENGQHYPYHVLYRGIREKATRNNSWLYNDYGYVRLFSEGKYSYLRFDIDGEKRNAADISIFKEKLFVLCNRSKKHVRLMLCGKAGWKHKLATSLGFIPIREFMEMESRKKISSWGARVLDKINFTIESFSSRLNLNEFNSCYNEIFADSFEHTPTRIKDWKRAIKGREISRNTLFLLRDRAQSLAGFALVSHFLHKGNRGRYGFIEDLGVRKRWRGRGLGVILLKYSIIKLRERFGTRQVRLHVDSKNESGAVRLYRRNGFRIVSQTMEYQYEKQRHFTRMR